MFLQCHRFVCILDSDSGQYLQCVFVTFFDPFDCFGMLHPRPCLHFGPHLNHTLTRTWFQAAILPSYREQNAVEHLYLPHINMSTFPHFSFTPLASHAYEICFKALHSLAPSYLCELLHH
ncbi:hypothetical protein ILYODFUR_038894 [Ilyodon furcidens]|uniref:Uncharacterized protein n=1 Tax=Ilyodon furcidens TaxID=33524 RepID=A0ABV0V0L3_9TELE